MIDNPLIDKVLRERGMTLENLAEMIGAEPRHELPTEPVIPLRHLRWQYGMSQSCLAELLGVNQATVSRWERGVEHISNRWKHQMIDLFSNRFGKFDPLIKKLLAQVPFVAVFDKTANFCTLPVHWRTCIVSNPVTSGEEAHLI